MMEEEYLDRGDYVLPEALIAFMAGSASGISQVLVGMPFDFVKVRLQCATTPLSLSTLLRDTIRHEGY